MAFKSLLRYSFILTTTIFIYSACTKDRLYFPTEDNNSENDKIVFGDLVINEFVAKGSANVNEFGSAEDWIEIYNNTNKDIQIGKNQLYITDDYHNNPLKYALPKCTIRSKGFLLVWADSRDTVVTEIHSNFKLSSSGEAIGLFWVQDGETMTLDTITYAPQTTDGVSNARIPDGSNNWDILDVPTPNAPNSN